MAAGYDISASIADSASAKQGGAFGDFNFSAGGQKQQSQLLLLVGVGIAGLVIVAIFFLKGRR
jgi:hypothetical protein